MKQNHLQDQRGVAMVVELLLVAVVLSFVGLAVYQSTQNHTASKAQPVQSVDNSTVGLAASAAAIGQSEEASDANVAASADATADQLKDTDVDMSNLGGSTSASSF